MRRQLFPRLALLIAPLAVLAACGDDSDGAPASTAAAPAVEALRYVANGGCQMMGPNCATYVVYSDGTVEISRTGEGTPAEVIGAIPAAEIAAYMDSVAGIDIDALADEVGPGTCNACVDGIDVVLTLTTADEQVVLDSTVIDFDPEHPFFVNLDLLMVDVFAVGELPILQRP